MTIAGQPITSESITQPKVLKPFLCAKTPHTIGTAVPIIIYKKTIIMLTASTVLLLAEILIAICFVIIIYKIEIKVNPHSHFFHNAI